MGAVAVQKKIETIDTEVLVERDELVKALFIDDEKPLRDGLEQEFKRQGFDIHTAGNPDEALALLRSHSYELIIADIFLEKSEMTGDQLIVEYKDLLGSATIIATTGGGIDRIARWTELKAMGVEFVGKGKGGIATPLLKVANRRLNERREEVRERVTLLAHSAVQRPMGTPLATGLAPGVAQLLGMDSLVDDLATTLIEWLDTRQELDRKSIIHGGEVFSARELAEEIRKGSEVGKAQIEGMVELFKEYLRII